VFQDSGEFKGPDIDVFEAYWGDMIPKQTDVHPVKKLLQGFDLLFYWLFNYHTWRALIVSPYVSLGLMAGALILILWYMGLAFLVADSIGKDPGIIEKVKYIPYFAPLVKEFIEAAAQVGNWQLWAVTAFILSFVPVDELVQMAYFFKDYFENKPDETEVGLRERIRKKVTKTIQTVLNSSYDEVFVVAHSFGTLIAVDILADWPQKKDFKKLTLVTLGSPISVLHYRSRWLKTQLQKILHNSDLVTWFDFYADTDWLCTKIAGHKERYGSTMSRPVDFEAPLRQKISGQTHMLYYRDMTILKLLAGPLEQIQD
jgi:hypothetical protein